MKGTAPKRAKGRHTQTRVGEHLFLAYLSSFFAGSSNLFFPAIYEPFSKKKRTQDSIVLRALARNNDRVHGVVDENELGSERGLEVEKEEMRAMKRADRQYLRFIKADKDGDRVLGKRAASRRRRKA